MRTVLRTAVALAALLLTPAWTQDDPHAAVDADTPRSEATAEEPGGAGADGAGGEEPVAAAAVAEDDLHPGLRDERVEWATERYAPHVEPPSDEGRAAMDNFTLAEGLEVSLFAAEPLLANPVCLYVDRHGDVYVGETFRHHAGVTDIREHMDWLDDDLASETVEDRVAYFRERLGDDFDSFTTEHDRLRLLRDTDGDGVADFARVFADGFDDPAAGIGAGVLVRDGDVYYTCIPDLWWLRDMDGDGRADRRRALSTGWGVRVAYLGHDLHGLRIGPDGRLYFSIGDRGFHVETESGVLHHPDRGAVLRCELDGSDLEVVHLGLRNPQELAFDDFGNLFTGDNNADAGDVARWVYVVEGGDSGWRQPYQWLPNRGPWKDEGIWDVTRDDAPAYIVPPLANFSSGPSGLTHYPGTGLGPEYQDHFFLCDFLGGASSSGVLAFDVTPSGASFEVGEREQFIWGVLATDAEFGPDGALYVSDWIGGWNTQGKGRIYKVVDPTQQDDVFTLGTRALLAEGVAARGAEELGQLLSHPDQRVRTEAHLELAERGDEGLEVLLEWLAYDDWERELIWTEAFVEGGLALGRSVDEVERSLRLMRLHALWGAGIVARKRPALTERIVSRTLIPTAGDADPELRAQAVRLLGDLRAAGSTETVRAAIDDESERVRFFAAIAAGRLGDAHAIEALVGLADAAGDDAYLRHAAVMGLLGCADADDLRALADHASVDVRRATLLVMRRRGDERLARFLHDEAGDLVVEAARAIHDQPVPAAMSALADLIESDVLTASRGDSAVAAGTAVGEDAHDNAGDDAGEVGARDDAAGNDQDELAGSTLLDDDALVRRVLNANLHLGGATRAAALSRFALRDDARDDHRAEALSMLRSWPEPSPRDLVVGAWRPLEERSDAVLHEVVSTLDADGIGTAPDEVLTEWVGLVEDLGAAQLAPRLVEIVDDGTRGSDVRTAALDTLESLEWPALDAVVGRALADPDGDLRARALDVLEGFAPQEALPRLPGILAGGEYPEQRVALGILGRARDPRVDDMLVAQLERLVGGVFPDELTLDLVLASERRLGLLPPEDAEGDHADDDGEHADSHDDDEQDAEARRRDFVRLAGLLERHRANHAFDPELGPWLDGLYGGDRDAGGEIFRRPALSCERCHAVDEDDPGQRVGPSLAGVGRRLARVQMLESIVVPNRRTAPGYSTTNLFLHDGEVIAGRILDEVDGVISIQDADGEIFEIAEEQVELRRAGLSAMPEELVAQLTREELRDLLAYLGSL